MRLLQGVSSLRSKCNPPWVTLGFATFYLKRSTQSGKAQGKDGSTAMGVAVPRCHPGLGALAGHESPFCVWLAKTSPHVDS